LKPGKTYLVGGAVRDALLGLPVKERDWVVVGSTPQEMLDQGFKRVYHLDGGILNYLETVDKEDSLWEGDCFVFDNRVTVDHDLAAGDFEVCPACRMPVTAEDRESPLFELHVSCPQCHHRLTEQKREGLLERARQIELAMERGERHLGNKSG